MDNLVHRKRVSTLPTILGCLACVAAFVLVWGSIAYADTTPPEFQAKWSEGRYMIEEDRRVEGRSYSRRSFHSYHIELTELKWRPNKMQGSKAWVIKRIVHPKPDAVMLFGKAPNPWGYYEVPLACLEYKQGEVYLIWVTENVARTLVDVILRAEGYCPI